MSCKCVFRPVLLSALSSVRDALGTSIVTDKGHKSKSHGSTIVEFWIKQLPSFGGFDTGDCIDGYETFANNEDACFFGALTDDDVLIDSGGCSMDAAVLAQAELAINACADGDSYAGRNVLGASYACADADGDSYAANDFLLNDVLLSRVEMELLMEDVMFLERPYADFAVDDDPLDN